MNSKRQLLYGLQVDALTFDDVIDRCHDAIVARRRLLLGVLNAAKVVKLQKDKLLRDAIGDCDLLLADGQSIVWASRLLRKPLPERIAGIDIFERLLRLADQHCLSVALLGATPAVLESVERVVKARFPQITVAFRHHGYYPADQASAIAQAIAQSKADILFLGMTSPKKEVFLGTYGSRLNVPVLHGVGGSFDIMAGITNRAPLAWQKAGMEWAYRLLQEPQRLWWRYLTTNLGFIGLTLREMLHPARAFDAHVGLVGEKGANTFINHKLQGAADE